MTKEELQEQLAEIERQEKEELTIKKLAFAEQYKDVKYILETAYRGTYTCYTLFCVDEIETQVNNSSFHVYIMGAGVRLTVDNNPFYTHKSIYESDFSVSIGEKNKDEIVILTKEQYWMLIERYKSIVTSYEEQFKSFLNDLNNEVN